ncbi:MAG TPA: ATP-dependent acyl-CoA ligase [Thermoleophilaceae bacterium]|nr:ATP-dependent acyl-CoA ligase [Thermoleophilaceae bacterium]
MLTLPQLLERQAAALGDHTVIRAGGEGRTVAQMLDAAARRGGALAAAGIEPGDRVAVMSEGRLEALELWLGCAWLGAVFLPLNTALRGAQLEHVFTDSGARALIQQEQFAEQLDSVASVLPELRWDLDELPDGEPLPASSARPGDVATLLYTSGTTGPAKGVLCPQAQWYWWGRYTGDALGVRSGDVLATSLPLFHSNALGAFCQALVHGATLEVQPRFSASAFWTRLVDCGATVTYLLGAMVSILLRHPPSDADRAHNVRVALAPATGAEQYGPFEERFGIKLLDAWGSTETNCVISNTPEHRKPGTMGRTLPGFHARVVDDSDLPVPDGTPGELVVRAEEPFAFALGYHGRPEATVEAWRNLWFHTGDRVVRDADGWFTFLDRKKDSIRRRGENISSWEVEQVLLAHPDVATAAAVPVPSELGEDEVMACVVARAGATIDPAELISFCEPRMAKFAVPRYVQVLDQLPMTPNGKIQKVVLRERGVTEATWDREARPGRVGQ